MMNIYAGILCQYALVKMSGGRILLPAEVDPRGGGVKLVESNYSINRFLLLHVLRKIKYLVFL